MGGFSLSIATDGEQLLSNKSGILLKQRCKSAVRRCVRGLMQTVAVALEQLLLVPMSSVRLARRNEMSDKELLELAAKAAGWNIFYRADEPDYHLWRNADEALIDRHWNPLTDDGDAQRLAVKLGIIIQHQPDQAVVVTWSAHVDADYTEAYKDDPYAATRRAIVRAAASIGEMR